MSGDGDTWLEAGEALDVVSTLRNVGRRGTSGQVAASVTALSPHVRLVTNSATTPGAAASRSNATATFRITLAAAVPTGAAVGSSATLVLDGITRTVTVPLFAGVGARIASDDRENPSGWTVGLALDFGDGAWTRVDPVQAGLIVSPGGWFPWQPEDDHARERRSR